LNTRLEEKKKHPLLTCWRKVCSWQVYEHITLFCDRKMWVFSPAFFLVVVDSPRLIDVEERRKFLFLPEGAVPHMSPA